MGRLGNNRIMVRFREDVSKKVKNRILNVTWQNKERSIFNHGSGSSVALSSNPNTAHQNFKDTLSLPEAMEGHHPRSKNKIIESALSESPCTKNAMEYINSL